MKFDLIITGGTIVTPASVFEGNLAVSNEKVAALLLPGELPDAEQVIDASGKYILPGAMDVHVHAGYGEPHRETLTSASSAAAAGGITTMLDQPLSKPSTITLEAFQEKLEHTKGSFVIDYGFWGGLVPGHLDELKPLFDAGGQAFKSFMCRCSNYPSTDDGTLLKGLQMISEWGGLVGVHAESDMLINQLVEDFRAQGKDDVDAFLLAHPPYTELEAIKRFIFIAQQVPGCKGHVVHMSLPEGALAIKRARTEGLDISMETCPQYLGLNDEDLRRIGGIAKCDPPVRPQTLVDELWEYVIDGTIDMVASDHSPHTFDKKVVPKDSFSKASEGVMGLQTMLPVVVHEGLIKRQMSVSRLAEVTALNPAKRFGLYPRKGHLSVGADADFYLLDLEKQWECKAEEMFYVNKHTPYDGRTFTGQIEKTFVRGQLVFDGGNIEVQPGFGEFMPMEMNTA